MMSILVQRPVNIVVIDVEIDYPADVAAPTVLVSAFLSLAIAI